MARDSRPIARRPPSAVHRNDRVERGYALVRKGRIQKTGMKAGKGDVVVASFDIYSTRVEAEAWARIAFRGLVQVVPVDLVLRDEEETR